MTMEPRSPNQPSFVRQPVTLGFRTSPPRAPRPIQVVSAGSNRIVLDDTPRVACPVCASDLDPMDVAVPDADYFCPSCLSTRKPPVARLEPEPVRIDEPIG